MLDMKRRLSVRVLSVAASLGAAAILSLVLVNYLRSRDQAGSLLQKADELSWNNRWIAAAPLYRKAESQLTTENRPSLALYAHVSQFIPRAESESIPDLLVSLQEDLKRPEAQEPETQLRILVIKGMIETNYDSALALATWGRVAELATKRHHYQLAARAIGEQGIAAFMLGDIAKAKKQVIYAWTAAKFLRDPAARVRYASVYGTGLNELHRYNEALVPLGEAIKTAASSTDIAYPSIAVSAKIDSLRGLHRYNEALSLADDGIQHLPAAELDAHLFQLFTSKGQIYEEMGKLDLAIDQYNRAVQYARQLHFWRGITQTGGLLARAYEAKNQLPLALSSIDEAIAANTHIPQELFNAPRNLAIKAEIEQKLKHLTEAHQLYQKSAVLIDSLIASVPTPNIERQLLSEMNDVYAGYFAALLSEGDKAGAFAVVEKERGRIEAQALQHHEAVTPHRPTAQEQQLTELNLELLNSDDPQHRQLITQHIYDAELHLDNDSLAGRTASNPVSLPSLQHGLNTSQLAIEYVLAEKQSYAIAITHESFHVYVLPSQSVLEQDATQYRRELREQKMDQTLGQRLYSELLGSIREMSSKPSLIIVPDGKLHLLPFSTLISKGKFLVETHTISVSPSATVLYLLQGRQHELASDPLPYVGVAAWAKVQESRNIVLRAISGPARSQLVSLPESRREVETIADDLPKPSTILIGSAATESEFKNLPLQEYNVIHLALHGYADLEYPDRSALLFAPEAGGADDGMLQVREIRNLHLNARLVTLSACDTGIGPVGAAGVTNIVNAFIEAGADSVVSTLWELEDHSTERLMASFYSHLSHREDKAEALRAAQLEMLKKGVAPYYWASFELVGDPDGTI